MPVKANLPLEKTPHNATSNIKKPTNPVFGLPANSPVFSISESHNSEPKPTIPISKNFHFATANIEPNVKLYPSLRTSSIVLS